MPINIAKNTKGCTTIPDIKTIAKIAPNNALFMKFPT